MPRRRGRALERFVSVIEASLNTYESKNIESPGFVVDRVSGRKREFDVLISLSGHPRITIAVECRDRNTKVGSPDVEAFIQKCSDSGIHKAVFVSSSGFSKPALRKAKMRNVQCILLEDVSSFDWLAAPGMVVREKRLAQAEWKFAIAADIRRITSFSVLNYKGLDLKPIGLERAVRTFLNSSEVSLLDVGEYERTVVFTGTGLSVRDNVTGEVHIVEQLIGRFRFEIIEKNHPFKLNSYQDIDSGEQLANVAVSQIPLGKHSASLTLVMKGNQGGSVYLDVERNDD
ncbi:MAG: restriction endonuclease [Acidobacteria bacterium]|nr:MAG: restriction endonuclease [Acidobacteriota bacterium]REK03023.1 MAG: restriction endonuclease [Acidobacteriota bacterium]REK13173.1 MAG: restriction endonuclease [Acidobacteriota bacterium]REK41167.1 MAG: restriction endonuclease [Acidobacteriota bacterium]